jgi:two-component system response regulator PhoP
MRLLVIEDDATLRETLCSQLADAGFGVEHAADGREGLYFALEYPIDLAIIDLGLPEISGLDVIRQLREKGKSYPVLILTARDRWQDKVDGLSAGADDYVVKPFHFEEVTARVNALLRRSGGWASSVLSAGPVTLDTMRQELSVDDRSRSSST